MGSPPTQNRIQRSKEDAATPIAPDPSTPRSPWSSGAHSFRRGGLACNFGLEGIVSKTAPRKRAIVPSVTWALIGARPEEREYSCQTSEMIKNDRAFIA